MRPKSSAVRIERSTCVSAAADDRVAAAGSARHVVRQSHVAFVELDVVGICAIAAIGELVEDDDVVARAPKALHEVRADEAAPPETRMRIASG